MFAVSTFILTATCKNRSSSDQTTRDTTSIQSSKTLITKKSDAIDAQLISGNELMTHDLVEMKIIDTSVTTELSETCYCDTTIQLNDSVYYSIISVNDEAGVCTYFFAASLDKQRKTVIASKYLHPDCDVDYSQDTYKLYDHNVVSNDKIEIIRTTVFQKKNRTSPDEEKNIDHKQEHRNYLIISPSGQIRNTK